YLAAALIGSGNKTEGATQLAAACRGVDSLVRRSNPKPTWQQSLIRCLSLKAQLALDSGGSDQALGLANQAINVARAVHSVDKTSDAFRLAQQYLLSGDVNRARGDLQAARQS